MVGRLWCVARFTIRRGGPHRPRSPLSRQRVVLLADRQSNGLHGIVAWVANAPERSPCTIGKSATRYTIRLGGRGRNGRIATKAAASTCGRSPRRVSPTAWCCGRRTAAGSFMPGIPRSDSPRTIRWRAAWQAITHRYNGTDASYWVITNRQTASGLVTWTRSNVGQFAPGHREVHYAIFDPLAAAWMEGSQFYESHLNTPWSVSSQRIALQTLLWTATNRTEIRVEARGYNQPQRLWHSSPTPPRPPLPPPPPPAPCRSASGSPTCRLAPPTGVGGLATAPT